MFILQVYKHSKWLCVMIVFFMAAQLFINYKHGIVASPFFHYGMYSQQMKIKKSYDVWEVKVNGAMLRGKDFSPQKWDKIMLPVQYYSSINSSNRLYATEVKRLFSKLQILTEEKDFLQTCNLEAFEKWYKTYLQTIVNLPIAQLEISVRIYNYGEDILKPSDFVKSLAQLCN